MLCGAVIEALRIVHPAFLKLSSNNNHRRRNRGEVYEMVEFVDLPTMETGEDVFITVLHPGS